MGQVTNTPHIASSEEYGLESVAFPPGYNVGISVGNCSFIAIRTTSNTTYVVRGDKACSLPVTANTSPGNARLKLAKERAITQSKRTKLVLSLPRVHLVKVRHQQAQQEGEGLRLWVADIYGGFTAFVINCLCLEL